MQIWWCLCAHTETALWLAAALTNQSASRANIHTRTFTRTYCAMEWHGEAKSVWQLRTSRGWRLLVHPCTLYTLVVVCLYAACGAPPIDERAARLNHSLSGSSSPSSSSETVYSYTKGPMVVVVVVVMTVGRDRRLTPPSGDSTTNKLCVTACLLWLVRLLPERAKWRLKWRAKRVNRHVTMMVWCAMLGWVLFIRVIIFLKTCKRRGCRVLEVNGHSKHSQLWDQWSGEHR